MAEFDKTTLVGQFLVAPTAAELALIREVDTGLRFRNTEKFHEHPASHVIVPVSISSAPVGTTPSMVLQFPFPVKLWAVRAGARLFGTATALTVNVLVDRGAGFASVLDAPTDLFAAGAGVLTEMAPESGQENLDAGDLIRLDFAATTGAVTDAMALLIGQRR